MTRSARPGSCGVLHGSRRTGRRLALAGRPNGGGPDPAATAGVQCVGGNMRILTLALLAISFAVPAPAAEITVLAGMGVISGVSDLAPAYEKLTGHSVVVRFEQAAAMNEKINSGAPADIAALQPEQVDNFIKQGKMVAGTKTNFAQAGVGLAVKNGAVRPERSTVDVVQDA